MKTLKLITQDYAKRIFKRLENPYDSFEQVIKKAFESNPKTFKELVDLVIDELYKNEGEDPEYIEDLGTLFLYIKEDVSDLLSALDLFAAGVSAFINNYICEFQIDDDTFVDFNTYALCCSSYVTGIKSSDICDERLDAVIGILRELKNCEVKTL